MTRRRKAHHSENIRRGSKHANKQLLWKFEDICNEAICVCNSIIHTK